MFGRRLDRSIRESIVGKRGMVVEEHGGLGIKGTGVGRGMIEDLGEVVVVVGKEGVGW